jgi:hypothetical protein
MNGVLKIAWSDGYEGIVDMRGIFARSEIFEPIRDPDYFRRVRVERYGHCIYWGDDEFTQKIILDAIASRIPVRTRLKASLATPVTEAAPTTCPADLTARSQSSRAPVASVPVGATGVRPP